MHTTPLILVTNDDGVGSPGLWAAVQGALLLGDVIVAAPHTQQTGMGRAFPGRRIWDYRENGLSGARCAGSNLWGARVSGLCGAYGI
ncbi:MAG: 5'/3'-nucleotidase SurE [Blautia sp.]